jgi:hypothetical protein
MAAWGSLVGDDYPKTYGQPFTSMPKDSGTLIVYALK